MEGTLALIVPFIAIVAAVLVVGGLWLWWTSEDDTGEQLSRAQRDPRGQTQAAAQPAEQSAFARAVSPSSPASAVDDDAVEVLRLLRDLADGTLIVEINGQRYRRLADITDAQVGRRFIGNAQALARFARLGDVKLPDSPEIPVASTPPPVTDAPASPAAEPPPAPQPEPRQPARPEPAPSTGRSGGLFSIGGRDEEEEEEEARPLTMAEQIEQMLQERLANSQQFAGQSLHIHSTPAGGIRIEINGTHYEAISDVPESPELTFIKATIQAWEEQQ